MSTFSDKAKSIIGALAPTIATALGGPFAGAAVSALAKALGLSPTSEPAAVEAAVTAANPDDLAKVKLAEVDFQSTMASLGVEREQLAYADTASARGREQIVKDKTPTFLAAGVTLGFFGILLFMMLGKPAAGGDALLVMLGSLATAWANVIGYYFGSSAGSDAKTTLLVQAGKAAAPKT